MTKQVLDENLLISDFTFGFELEGCVSGDGEIGTLVDEKIHYYDNGDESESEVIQNDTILDELTYLLKKSLDENAPDEKNIDLDKAKVHVDGSISTENNKDYAFEFSSPIFPCKPSIINAIVKFLYSLLSKGEIYTNDSCGFHHHISFNGITERDMVWIYCNLCCDESARRILEKNGEDFNLYNSEYASYTDLIQIYKSIKNDDYESVLVYLNTEKYRAFRIHPQGTLEWRGPRDFLDSKQLKYIKSFYKLLWYLMSQISKYLKSDTLTNIGITKKEFFNKLSKAVKDNPNYSRSGEFLIYKPSNVDTARGLNYKSDYIKKIERDPKAFDRFMNSCDNNPKIWISLVNNNPKITGKILSIAKRDYKFSRIVSIYKHISDKVNDKNVLKDFIDNTIDIWSTANIGSSLLSSVLTEKMVTSLDSHQALKIESNNLDVDRLIRSIANIVKNGGQLSLGEVKAAIDYFISRSSTYSAVIGELCQESNYTYIGIKSTKKLLFHCVKNTSVHEGYNGNNDNCVFNFIKKYFDEQEVGLWNKILLTKSKSNAYAIKYVVLDLSNGIPEELKWAYIRNSMIANLLPREVREKLEQNEQDSYNDLI